MVLPAKEHFTPGAMGAVSLVVRDMLRATKGQADCTVIGAPPGGPPTDGAGFIAADPHPLARLLLGQARAYAGAVARACRAAAPQLVEVHNRPDLALALARRLRGMPVALVLHNDPQGMRFARSPAQRAALLRRLAAIACVSGYLRSRLLQGIDDAALAERAHVLPNGIDLGALPAPAEQRDQRFLFIGRLTADKGFDSFVRAAAIALPQLPGWQAAAIGADRFGPDSPETPFIRAIRPQAAAAGVQLLGYLPNAETMAALSRAAILVMPSRWPEPFGRVAQEAQACGAALIASTRGGLPEAAGEAAVIIDPEDPAAIAVAMLRLAGDAALRDRLTAGGHAWVQRFGLVPTGQRWAALRAAALAPMVPAETTRPQE